tara:strand:+ start:480 stop:1004 length:525 start_codon:yes stop_codon:yes gene_type:complete
MTKWESFAQVAFYAMKGVLPLWKDASSDTARAMTRILYDQVFCCGSPNKTGYISSAAMSAKRERLKTCKDHCLSPQFVARMVYDQPEVWLTDFEEFKKLFFLCCQTIVVTPEENNKLSTLTSNRDGVFIVKVPTVRKYHFLNIKLFHPKKGYVSNPFEDMLPEGLTEYEEQFVP